MPKNTIFKEKDIINDQDSLRRPTDNVELHYLNSSSRDFSNAYNNNQFDIRNNPKIDSSVSSGEQSQSDIFSTSQPSPDDIPHSKWLDNQDLRPTPVKDRTWGPWTSYLFWFSAAANLSNWYSPTSFMTTGLTMWEALFVHFGGQAVAGIFMAINGRGGAIYHIGYPVIVRASFGWLGAVWPIIQRIVMSIIWNGVNVVQGGQCVYVMLHAIFPSIANLPNGMAKTDALNTGGMIGLTIFWFILTLCLWFIPIPKLRFFLVTKVPVFAISAIAMLVWTLTLSGGLPHEVISSRNGKVLTKSERNWLLCRFIFLSWANNSTFIVNAADLQRYTRRPNDAIFGQIFGFPISNFIIGLVGVIVGATSVKVIKTDGGTNGGVAGSSKSTTGQVIWNPIIYLDMIQTQNYTAANRAGAFMLAFCFAYCGLFSCIVENILPAGNDLSALWPKYLTIRRCFIICALLTFACVPWKLLGTANNFISWLSSYQIFLSSVTGVMLCHYYFISGGLLMVEPDLFSSSKNGVYYYTYGINIRAYISYFLGMAPNFYGFLGQVGLNITTTGKRLYYFAYPIGVFVSFVTYFIFSIAYPPKYTTIEYVDVEETDNIDKNTHEIQHGIRRTRSEKSISNLFSRKTRPNYTHNEFNIVSHPRSEVDMGEAQTSDIVDKNRGDIEKRPVYLRHGMVSSQRKEELLENSSQFKSQPQDIVSPIPDEPGSEFPSRIHQTQWSNQRKKTKRAKRFGIIPIFTLHWREPSDFISRDDPCLQQVDRATEESNNTIVSTTFTTNTTIAQTPCEKLMKIIPFNCGLKRQKSLDFQTRHF